MTATNMCSNFGGFRCRPPLSLWYLCKHVHHTPHANLVMYLTFYGKRFFFPSVYSPEVFQFLIASCSNKQSKDKLAQEEIAHEVHDLDIRTSIGGEIKDRDEPVASNSRRPELDCMRKNTILS